MNLHNTNIDDYSRTANSERPVDKTKQDFLNNKVSLFSHFFIRANAKFLENISFCRLNLIILDNKNRFSACCALP